MAKELTAPESKALTVCERTIEQGLPAFVGVGRALAEIRGGKLWRQGYDSFAEYCQTRWEFGNRRARQLINAALDAPSSDSVKATNGTNGSSFSPVSERQARALSAVPDEYQAEVMERAGAGGKVTAASIRKAAADVVAGEPERVVITDALDAPVTEAKVIKAFEAAGEIKSIMADIQRIRMRIRDEAEGPCGPFLRATKIDADLKNAKAQTKYALPYANCPYCRANRTHGCKACKKALWVNKAVYDAAPEEMR